MTVLGFRCLRIGATVVLLALLAGCRSWDPEVFDERLRMATFDVYAEAIERLHLDAAEKGLTRRELARRYRQRAADAADARDFYDVLTHMLVDLQDPHAELSVSSRHWPDGDLLGVPHDGHFLRIGERLYLGWREAAAISRPLERPSDRSAVGLSRALRETIVESDWRWEALAQVEGRSASLSAVRLLECGELLTTLSMVVDTPEGPREILLPRNAAKIPLREPPGTVAVVGPEGLCRILDGVASGRTEIAFSELAPALVGRRRPTPVFPETTRLLDPVAPWGLEAFRAGAIGGVRLASFALTNGDRGAGLKELEEHLDRVFREVEGCDGLILDLQGNGGGEWVAMASFVSRFLPEHVERIPHRITRIRQRGIWPFRFDQRIEEYLERRDVPRCGIEEVVVLVDQRTASAAEIVAAVLQAHGAILIGERTSGSEYATERVAGPDGSEIRFGLGGGMEEGYPRFQGIGLNPDIEVPVRLDTLRARGWQAALDEQRRGMVRTAVAELTRGREP